MDWRRKLIPRAELYPDLAAALAANPPEPSAEIDYRSLVVIEHLALFDNVADMMKRLAGRKVNLSPTVWAALCVALAQSVRRTAPSKPLAAPTLATACSWPKRYCAKSPERST